MSRTKCVSLKATVVTEEFALSGEPNTQAPRTKRSKLVGNGFTAKVVEVLDLSKPEDAERFRELVPDPEKTFRDDLLSLAELFADFLRRKGLPYTNEMYVKVGDKWVAKAQCQGEHDLVCSFGSFPTVEPFAAGSGEREATRMLECCWELLDSIDKGDALNAACVAYNLGFRNAKSYLKAHWERSALHGKRMREGGSQNILQRNKSAWQGQAKKWAEWNEAAAAIWGRNPDLSREAVAQLVKKQLKPKESWKTVWRHIRKPDALA